MREWRLLLVPGMLSELSAWEKRHAENSLTKRKLHGSKCARLSITVIKAALCAKLPLLYMVNREVKIFHAKPGFKLRGRFYVHLNDKSRKNKKFINV